MCAICQFASPITNDSIAAEENEPVFNNSFAMTLSQIEGSMQTQQNTSLEPIKKHPLENNKLPVLNPAFFEPNSIPNL